MTKPKHNIVLAQHDTERGTLRSYTTGFVLSVSLTLLAYLAAIRQTLSGRALMVWLLGLAVVQFVVQLFFFLHIGKETRPRWKLLVLFIMIVVVLIVVIGSIWIMYNLNYRMTPQQMNTYMQSQNDGGL